MLPYKISLGAILTSVAPPLHSDSWAPVLGRPDTMHAEPQGAALKKKKKTIREHGC